MSKSMLRFRDWISRADGEAVKAIRLIKSTPARHKGRNAHPRVMSQQAGRSYGQTALTVRIPDGKGYLIYEVVTSNPAATAAKIAAGAWL